MNASAISLRVKYVMRPTASAAAASSTSRPIVSGRRRYADSAMIAIAAGATP